MENVEPFTSRQKSAEILTDVSIERIRLHIRALEGTRHPLASPSALDKAAAYVHDSLQSLGYGISVHFFNDNRNEYRNIIATKTGTTFPDELVILLAHFDTVENTPGADDNASGVAVMLELARILAPLGLEKSVLFVGVNLEENGIDGCGRRGSRAIAAHAREKNWQVEGVIVLESVAYAGNSVTQSVPAGIPFKVPDIGDFIAVIGNEDSKELAAEFAGSNERHGIPLPFQTLIVPGRGEMLPDCRRSDHASFWDVGYRAIMLTDTTNFRNPNYHSPGDTLETLNLDFAVRVCRATAALIMEMAGIYNLNP